MEILTLVFIVLKICGVIAWSWWLVLLPEIIACTLYVLAIVIYILVAIIAGRKINKAIKEEIDW